MIITSINAVKIANTLEKKETLTKNEKTFLKYFSMFYYLLRQGYFFSLKTISMCDVKLLKIIKSKKKIKSLKSGVYYLDNFYFNVFCGNLKNVILSKSGFIKIYENRTYKLLNLLINGQNIFENSIVINRPNKTIFINKQFKVKLCYNGQKLVINSTKKFDNFNSKYFEILLSTKPTFTYTNCGLINANFLLLNYCKLSKNALKRKIDAKNNTILLYYEVNNTKTMQNYFNLKQVSLMLNFMEFSVSVEPLFLNNFKICENKNNVKTGTIIRSLNGVNKFIKSNVFNLKFYNGIIFGETFLSQANYKILLLPGEYKIIKTDSGLKIVNISINYTFYITFNCKLQSANILNSELVLNFAGNIQFTIANKPTPFQALVPYSRLEFIKLENVFLENIMLTLFTMHNSFYNLSKIDSYFYMRLKEIVKNKQSVRYAATKIIELANTVKTSEVKKIFKINGLLNSLPEKKTNLTDLINKNQILPSEIDDLTLEEQLELYKVKTHKVVEKFVKIC